MMDSNTQIELSVTTCMFNEEAIIEQNIDRLTTYLKTLPFRWELILVNDGSTDATLDIITKAAALCPQIKIVSYPKNRGRGYALRQGFRASRGRYVVTIESDLNYGVEIISEMLNAVKDEELAAVVASPYMPGGKVENVPFKRLFLSQFGNVVLRMGFGLPIHTFTGMTRCYNGDIIRSLPLEEDRKAIHLEILSKLNMLGFSISQVPAVLKWADTKKTEVRRKSKFSTSKIIKSHMLACFTESPLMLFGTLGCGLFLAGIVLGIHLFIAYFLRNQVIGDRIILVNTTVFLLLSGMGVFLVSFLATQIVNLRRELFKAYYELLRPSTSKEKDSEAQSQ